jgi:hypothetical protein
MKSKFHNVKDSSNGMFKKPNELLSDKINIFKKEIF